jgi:hypothetical protein
MSACFGLHNGDNLAKKWAFSTGFGGNWLRVETDRGLV